MAAPAKRKERAFRSSASITIDALERELARCNKVAEKAKAEAEECAGVAAELVALNRELAAIVAEKPSRSTLARLAALDKRHKAAQKILRKDYADLLDAQFHAEHDAKAVAEALGLARMRASWGTL